MLTLHLDESGQESVLVVLAGFTLPLSARGVRPFGTGWRSHGQSFRWQKSPVWRSPGTNVEDHLDDISARLLTVGSIERTFLPQDGARGLARMREAAIVSPGAEHHQARAERGEVFEKGTVTRLLENPGRTQTSVSSIDEVARRVKASTGLFCLARVGSEKSLLSKGARRFLGTKETTIDAVMFARAIFPIDGDLRRRWLKRAQILCQRHELVPIFRITLASPIDQKIVNLFLVSRLITTFDGNTYLLIHGRVVPSRAKDAIGTVLPDESCFLGSESAWRVALRDSDHELLLELDPEAKKSMAAVQAAMQNLRGMADIVGLQHIVDSARHQTEALGLPVTGKFSIKMIDGKPYRYLSYKDQTGVRRQQYVAPA